MTERADQRGWGNPFTPGFEDQIVSVTAGGITVRVHRVVADIFRYLNTQLAHTYNLAGYADDWGYNRRPIRGYEQQWTATHDLKYLSNHSWGLAEDADASVNPMTSDLRAHHEIVRAVVDPILKPFGGRLVWGGEYSSARKDYMHFEYGGTRDQAITDSAKARQLLNGAVTAHATAAPSPIVEEPDMRIIHSPSHSYARLPGLLKLDPKTTLPIYRDKLKVPVVELSDADWMAVANAEKAAG